MYRRIALSSLVAALACARGESGPATHTAIAADTTAGPEAPASVALATAGTMSPSAETPAGAPAASAPGARAPNELGRIPIFEYHLIGEKNAEYERERTQFRKDLELMYERGYRPISVSEMLDEKIDLPAGLSPMVLVFDDASPSQFRYIERNGKLEIDPTSAVGILLDFAKTHPGWRNRAVFCMLPAAQAGRSFFGDKGIEGQKTEWRYQKVRFLHEQGFELCNHTLYHARLDRAGEKVQEFIARGDMAIDSVVPGYRVRTMALPLGMWPKNRELAHQGSWRDPKSGKVISYRYDAILEVAGGPARSPYDPKFNPLSIPRVPVVGNVVQQTINQLEKSGTGYVSDGNPATVARPAQVAAAPAKPPAAKA
ncbi:MAG TPA: hypothetical protein VFS05_07445, partial [Gemmatimonadaceae bacterium]|nr:hypothetical protein [Gemmatimonadaceae bacterium]